MLSLYRILCKELLIHLTGFDFQKSKKKPGVKNVNQMLIIEFKLYFLPTNAIKYSIKGF